MTTSAVALRQAVGACSSEMTRLKTMVMLATGLIAALGIWSGTVHVVIGAALIAPAYEPIARLVLGLVAQHRAPLLSGLQDTTVAFAAIMTGALIAGLLVQLFAADPLDGPDTYVATGTLLTYWTTLSWSAIALSVTAGAVGGLLILLDRTVLTAGVVIVLALVPAATIVGLAVSGGAFDLALSALGRWAVDVVLVVVTCALVFLVKRSADGRRMAGGGRTGAL